MRHNDPVSTPNFGPANRVVIIGGGPGGYEAALVAAQLGAEVTVVDSDGLGGSAVVTDCVPSKTLIATAELMTDLEGAPELGVGFEDHEGDAAHHVVVDLDRVNHRVKRLAADQSDDIGRRLDGRACGWFAVSAGSRAASAWSSSSPRAGPRRSRPTPYSSPPEPRRARCPRPSPTASGSSPGSRSTTSPSRPRS